MTESNHLIDEITKRRDELQREVTLLNQLIALHRKDDSPERNKILNLPALHLIDGQEPSYKITRIKNLFVNMNIKTIGDLIKHEPCELYGYNPNFGRKSLMVLVEAVKSLGIEWKGRIP